MGRFIEGCDSREQLFLPACVDDYVAEESPVRIVDVFDELELAALGVRRGRIDRSAGVPSGDDAEALHLRYLNQVQSSRRLEREAGRNVELMWLTGKLAPDFKTIADFRREHGAAIQAACRRFVVIYLGLIAGGMVALDGSRFRTVNARDRNFTPVMIQRQWSRWTPALSAISACSTLPIDRRARPPNFAQHA